MLIIGHRNQHMGVEVGLERRETSDPTPPSVASAAAAQSS
jgi:hypothetical protein